jgi:hypothetical protein
MRACSCTRPRIYERRPSWFKRNTSCLQHASNLQLLPSCHHLVRYMTSTERPRCRVPRSGGLHCRLRCLSFRLQRRQWPRHPQPAESSCSTRSRCSPVRTVKTEAKVGVKADVKVEVIEISEDNDDDSDLTPLPQRRKRAPTPPQQAPTMLARPRSSKAAPAQVATPVLVATPAQPRNHDRNARYGEERRMCLLAAWENVDFHRSCAFAAWGWLRAHEPTLQPLKGLTGHHVADVLDSLPDQCMFVYHTKKGPSPQLVTLSYFTDSNRLQETMH